MDLPLPLTVISIGSILLAWLLWKNFTYQSPLPLPPGPKRKWLIGNLLDIPTLTPWLVYAEWGKKYGDILSLRGLGINIIVLNTLESVNALLEQKGNLYSNRPKLTMIGEIVGSDRSLPLLQYGSAWREQRKLMHFAMGPEAIKKYTPYQEDIVMLYLQSLLDKPKDFVSALRLAGIRVVMAMSYGFPVRGFDDEYVSNADELIRFSERAVSAGGYLVDLFPALKYLPNLFGLVPFQTQGAKYRRVFENMVADPFEQVKRNMTKGIAPPSFTSELLNFEDKDEEAIKLAASTMYAAGADTTYITVLNFIFAMALFPEKQKKAQDEIDEVVGEGRFPSLDDRPDLPYVDALIKEVMRWQPVTPLGIGHCSSEESVYKGYLIPAQSLVLANSWAISRDETAHDLPDDFIPERFLQDYDGKKPLDPEDYFWGFGRRICPGRFLAKNSVYIFVTAILSCFHIGKQLDAKGNEIPLSATFTGTALNRPVEFECRFVPRSPNALERIQDGSKKMYDELHI